MGMVTQDPFGRLVRSYRRDAELTQEALAERAGVSVRAVRDIEAGGRHRPRPDTVRLLMAALDVPPEKQAAFLAAAALTEHWRGGPQVAWDGAEPKRIPQDFPPGGFLGSLPTNTLVARESELEYLRRRVDTVSSGVGRLIMLRGEAGAGKTRLAQELTLHLLNHGFLVAAGRCYEAEQTVPYYPFLDALTAVYVALSDSIQQGVRQTWPYLGVLLPDLIGPPRSKGSGKNEQQLVLRAVAAFLTMVATDQPLALLLDDLHWADFASVKLLLHLAQHSRTMPILLLGTYRDVEVGPQHPLDGALRDLHRDDLVEQLDVSGLDEHGTGELVAVTMHANVSPELATEVYDRTDGNPYFVQQVLRVLVERGHLVPKDGMWDRVSLGEMGVPENIVSVVRHRSERLSVSTQEILREASVLGQHFTFDDLLVISAHGERDLEGALEEAGRAGLVRDLGHDAYSFDHALTQQSIYAELPSRRKRRLHLAAGEALVHLLSGRRAGRVAEIAWHFLQGDDAERALAWTLQAGDRAAAVFAYGDAEAQYRTAAELAQRLNDEPRELDAWERLGDVLDRAGRHGDAVEALERGALAERVQDRERYLGLVARIGQEHAYCGNAVEGIARLEAVVQQLAEAGIDGTPSPHVADVYAALAELYFHGGRWQQIEPAAQLAIRQAEASGNEWALYWGELSRGTWLIRANRPREAQRAFTRVTEIAERLGDPSMLAVALQNLAVCSYGLGQLEEAESHTRRAVTIAEHAALVAQSTFTRTNLAWCLVDQGRWDEARREAEWALAESRPLGARWMASYPLLILGRVLLFQGERDAGLRVVHEGLEMATQHDDLQGILAAQTTLALQELREGRAADVLTRLIPVLQRVRNDGFPLYVRLLLAIHAWAQVDAGSNQQAVDAVASARQQAEEGGFRCDLMVALLASAKLAVRQGRWDDAICDLDEGLAVAREIGLPYDEALLLYEHGRFDVARGQTEQGQSRLQAALAIFRKVGAHLEIVRTERALAEVGFEVRLELAGDVP